MENQATDRAYRIGQTHTVQAHHLLARDTFEEKINDLINAKRGLAEMAVGTGEQWIGQLSDRGLRERTIGSTKTAISLPNYSELASTPSRWTPS